MRFLIVNSDYPDFLGWLYNQHSGLEHKPYEEQRRVRRESLFGVADFYSGNLRQLGHEAWDIYLDNEFMQKAWAKEPGIRLDAATPGSLRFKHALQVARRLAARTPLRYLKPLFRPVLDSLESRPAWFYEILAAQIKHYKPDILLNQAMGKISSHFLKEIKGHTRLLVGQIASPLPREDFSVYDLVISSLPNFVTHFRNGGIASELHRLAFEPAILPRLNSHSVEVPVSFVGSLSAAHKMRTRWLEHVCSQCEIKVWSSRLNGLPPNSPIRSHYEGPAWGIEMYQILHASKMTLDYHIDDADSYANNLRLFEATGVGTLLITDWKENLHEMFELGKEVIPYRRPEECIELIRYYLDHERERESVAKAGQQRTLREHNYYHRMGELVETVSKYI